MANENLTLGKGGKNKIEKKKETKKSKKKNAKKTIVKKDKITSPKKVKLHIETNIDRLYEIVRDKGSIKLEDVAKKLKIDEENIEDWARILEEHNLVILHYPPIGDPTIILKKFKADTKNVIKSGPKRKLKFNKKAFFINIAIIIGFVAVVGFLTMRGMTIRISMSQLYLGGIALIIIIVIVLGIVFRKRWSVWLKKRPKPKVMAPVKKSEPKKLKQKT
ncbi:MAG: hypothetical protein KAS32_07505 [Candidatus Peribacteraceae bacterium]|nr:hypothetical protein [Candidatus Peribacteraceae bacterium]